MFVTIWMCTQEWSLISMRATALTFATCHQPFSWRSALTRSTSVRSLRLPRTGTLMRIRSTASRRGESRLALGLGRDGLLDSLLGLGVERRLGLERHAGAQAAVRARARSAPTSRSRSWKYIGRERERDRTARATLSTTTLAIEFATQSGSGGADAGDDARDDREQDERDDDDAEARSSRVR